jgi:hypothetical protein
MLQNLNEFRIPVWGTSDCYCWNDADYHSNMCRRTSGTDMERNVVSDSQVLDICSIYYSCHYCTNCKCLTFLCICWYHIYCWHSVLTAYLYFWKCFVSPLKSTRLFKTTKRIVFEYAILWGSWMPCPPIGEVMFFIFVVAADDDDDRFSLGGGGLIFELKILSAIIYFCNYRRNIMCRCVCDLS